MSVETIYNYLAISETLATSGQPTADQLRAAAAAGFTAVINLATSDSPHALTDEADLVRHLGMAYHHIPVVWDNPQPADFAAFEHTLSQLPPGKTLIHCIANFRVTAFYGLYAQKHLGWTATQADALRAQIWAGSDYPVWEQFIATLQTEIAAQTTHPPS